MAQLVADDDPQLVVIQQLDHAGIEHDEWLIDADRGRVDDRSLGDVELRNLGPVHGGRYFGEQGVQHRELGRSHAHRVGLEQQPDSPLSQESHDLAHDFIEPRDGPERLERRAIGGMFPRDGRDLGEDDPVAGGRDAGNCGLQ